MSIFTFIIFLGIINIVFGFIWKWVFVLPSALLFTVIKFRLPDVGRVFAGNFGNGDGTFFCKNGKDMVG